ncbi:uncharacterized protein LOC144563929 [Carex rostrata]
MNYYLQAINQELMQSKARLEELNETKRFLFGDLHKVHHTYQELEERETRLMKVLSRIYERKELLFINSSTLDASIPLPSMLSDEHNKLLQTTQGLVQMQLYNEGTSSIVQQESPFIQKTKAKAKANKGKILMQPPVEKNLDMKEDVVMEFMNSNEVPKYQVQTSVFNDKAVQGINNPMKSPNIAFGSFQVNPWEQLRKNATSTSTSTWTPRFSTTQHFPLF